MKTRCELISVVIPTFKRTDKLDRAIRSIIRQTYNNLEIIVVDDNAEYPEYRKDVEKIIKAYGKRIALIQNKKNLGGALSRNIGISMANGKYIAFLDDDDEYREDKIEKQYELLFKDKDLALVFSNNKAVDMSKNLIYQHMCHILATTSNWLVSKKILEEIGGFENIPNEQDTVLLLKMLVKGYKVGCIKEDLVIRHFHDKNDGIGGAKLKNVVGTERLRELCRQNYGMLDNKEQIADVELAIGSKLLDIYVYNRKLKEAKKEFKNMAKHRLFSKITAESFLKVYMFPIFALLKGIK